MSAIEQMPAEHTDRRRADRIVVAGSVDVVLGRGKGSLIDLSKQGARIRHDAAVGRGTTVRLSFEWAHERFSATAEVLTSRLISLGSGMRYESRMRFLSVDPSSAIVLASALSGIAGRSTRRMVANLRGWSDEVSTERTPLSKGSFLRCTLHSDRWWEQKVTSDITQPVDGFLLPSESTAAEVASLCDTYARGGKDQRLLIRRLAAEAVEQAQHGNDRR